jgi:predicted ATP-dependent endonuclease of OLD family
MKLRHVSIRNFRNLHNVSVPITDTTVLIGENNSGKTGLLDALKLTLLRSQARGNPFDEYDYHMARPEESIKFGIMGSTSKTRAFGSAPFSSADFAALRSPFLAASISALFKS